ncbi:MAG: signal peptide peptidase SppA [Rhodothermaeota bacterium MED-G19]|nr:MAG: signal peptide peptidase SppA [Rhodothermaeota bacterium MED-G19]
MNFLKEIFLGAIKGILSLVLAFIMLLIFFSIIGALFSPSTKEEISVSKNSLLYINNLNVIGDRDTKADELDLNFDIPLPLPILDNNQTEKISLITFESIINKAAEDDNIKGIYLNVDNVGISFNKAEKVRVILEEFKKKKPIYSYADLQTKGAYFISSVANFMAISPPGFISVSGFGVSSFFYKNMLDELGVNINLFRVGEYKGAAETYVRTDFSKENEEQYLNLLNYRMSNYLDKISISRAIDKDNLFSMIENFETELANDALNNKLVDSLIYEDEMVNYLKNKVDSSYKNISLLKYRKTLESNKYNRKKIAVLYAIGSILPGTGDDGIYSESIIKEIKKIKKNKNIKSVILYVNSGGGSAFASDLIARELELLNDEKPLIAYMSDVCASGGYYISMPADTLIASSGSIVGSIGVFGLFPEMSDLLNNKLKITTDQIRTNKNIGEIDPFRPLEEDEKKLVQRGVNQIYTDFLSIVADGRSMSTDEVDKLARGRVYYGNEGKKLNLIDIVGEFKDAINLAAKLADIEDYQIIEYPKQKTEIEKIISSLQQTKSTLDPFIKSNWLIESMIKNEFYDPFQMRMEFKID